MPRDPHDGNAACCCFLRSKTSPHVRQVTSGASGRKEHFAFGTHMQVTTVDIPEHHKISKCRSLTNEKNNNKRGKSRLEFALGTGTAVVVAAAKPALRSTISAGRHGFFSTMTGTPHNAKHYSCHKRRKKQITAYFSTAVTSATICKHMVGSKYTLALFRTSVPDRYLQSKLILWIGSNSLRRQISLNK